MFFIPVQTDDFRQMRLYVTMCVYYILYPITDHHHCLQSEHTQVRIMWMGEFFNPKLKVSKAVSAVRKQFTAEYFLPMVHFKADLFLVCGVPSSGA